MKLEGTGKWREAHIEVKVKEIMCKSVGIGHSISNLSAIWR